jgi:hypothetical protein
MLSLGCLSCRQNSDKSAPATDTSSTSNPVLDSTNQPSESTGVAVVTSNANGVGAETSGPTNDLNLAGTPTWFYTTNGNERLKTLITTKDGNTVSSKTFDEAGKLKWMDEFSYDSSNKNPVGMRRTKSDGTMFQVLYMYSASGQQTRIVIGPDGNKVPPENQDAYLNQ